MTEPRRETSWLVAAAVIAVLSLAGLGLVSSRSAEPGATPSAGMPDVQAWLPSVVPDGADLVSFHELAPGDWATPAEPWVTPGRHTLGYRDLTEPTGEPGFDLEVFPGLELDVDAALAGLGDDSEVVRVGGATGVRARGFGEQTSDRVVWQLPGTVVRIEAIGIPSDEVLAIAASVHPVDETTWTAALAGADVAPPYGFRGETAVVSGTGWVITAGMYRQVFGIPTGCAVVELDEPNPGDPGSPSCVSPYPVPESLRAELSADVHHVWVDGRLLVWGVVRGGGQSVRLHYDEGTFEAGPGDEDGPFRAVPIPGVDAFVFAAELEVARRPSRVELLDGAGAIVTAYQDLTARALPAEPTSP